MYSLRMSSLIYLHPIDAKVYNFNILQSITIYILFDCLIVNPIDLSY